MEKHTLETLATLGPVPPTIDLRMMVRRKITSTIKRQLEDAACRRKAAIKEGAHAEWAAGIVSRMRVPYGELPRGNPLNIRSISKTETPVCRIENLLFESFPGWDVNASLFLPNKAIHPEPWPAVVIPVGHSAKVYPNYQLPAQLFAHFGYAAVLFDPPGMAGEKQEGNDHFDDGVRCYLTGQTSNRYFVADALRCIDFLETRDDIDTARGVAMTGVSGGGNTTIYASLLDDRIKAAGPACCVAPSLMHPIMDFYSPCTETLPFGRFADGLDNVDLLCALNPTPTLLMCGRNDVVFHHEWSSAIADTVKEFYTTAGSGTDFRFFTDECGHAYSLNMAVEFTRWMDRYLVGRSPLKRSIPEGIEELDPERLACRPRQRENIHTLNRRVAIELTRTRSSGDFRGKLCELAGITNPEARPEIRRGTIEQVWRLNLQELMLIPETQIELPATLITPVKKTSLTETSNKKTERSGAILYFDDRHRWEDLKCGGMLSKAINTLNNDEAHHAVLSVDLRGWGDTAQAYTPFDIAGWADRSRWIAYVSAAMGDSVMGMRIRDAVMALNYLKALPEIDPDRIVVGGHGMGGAIALMLGVFDESINGVFSFRGPADFLQMATEPRVAWLHEDYFPGVLTKFDLPELVAGMKPPVLIAEPLNALKQAAEDIDRENLFSSVQLVSGEASEDAIVRFIKQRIQ